MHKDIRGAALEIIRAGIAAVDPEGCVRRVLDLEGDLLRAAGEGIPLRDIRRIIVVGFGKASARMARALEGILGERISQGLVITAPGYGVPTKRIEVVEASHPVPDERGLTAAARILDLVESAGVHDLVIVLISGGGSALLTLPWEGIPLEDLATLNRLLLRSGATIQEINAVRKHLSQVKGGRLAAAAYPARSLSLILSDVVGDPLDVIASGPTSPDPTTFADSVAVLKRHGIWDRVPETVRRHLERGLAGEVPETPKPGNPLFEKVRNIIVGSGRHAAQAAMDRAQGLGYNAAILTTTLEGEAREVGKFLAALARELVRHGRPLPKPAALVLAGETTVTVRGRGLGGRNQEVALSAAIGISGLPDAVVASVGTDGVDGPTDAAGGMVDGESLERMATAGVDPKAALDDNDSHHALGASGDLIVTGPTGTNVADLLLVLVGTPTTTEMELRHGTG